MTVRLSERPWTALAISTLTMTIVALPVFLVGALAVLIRAELGFSETALGLLASAYYLVSAVSSTPGGRAVNRLGGRRAIAVAGVISTTSMLGIAVLGTSYAVILAFMCLAGVANGFALPATNLVVARDVPLRHQGLAFGLKQSSGPIATLAAGSSVPLVAVTIGWEWAFIIVAVLAVPLVVYGRSARRPVPGSERPSGEVATGPLVVLAVGAAAAVVGGSSLGAFYVESLVAAGLTPGTAGTLLALGSVVGIGGRLGWGVVAGRVHHTHFPLLVAMMVAGSVSYTLLGHVATFGPVLLVTICTFVTGWGWPAVFNFAVVLRSDQAPAVASGIAATGLYAGGIVGPPLFGLIVQNAGYDWAWVFVALCVLVAAGAFLVGGRMLEGRKVTPP